MKKKLCMLLSATLLSACMALPAFADDRAVKVTLNGNEIQFSDSDGKPFVDEAGRTQVPMRKTMEALGCMVAWDQEEQVASVTQSNTVLSITIGKKEIDRYVFLSPNENMQDYMWSLIENDTAAIVKDSRTYLPIRVVAETFGGSVEWNEAAKTVEISIVPDPMNLRTAENGIEGVTLNLKPLQYVGKTLESIKADLGEPSEVFPYTGGIWYQFASAKEAYGFPLKEIYYTDEDGALNANDSNSFSIENTCVGVQAPVTLLFNGMKKPMNQVDLEKLLGGTVTYLFNIDFLAESTSASMYKVSIPGYDQPFYISCNLNGTVMEDDWINN